MQHPTQNRIQNRSMPAASIIPVLRYDDVRAAVAWLCDVLGFVERLRIADHRAQLVLGDAAIVVAERRGRAAASEIMVQIADVAWHHGRTSQRGARITQPPTDFPYGERQYGLEDLGGHRWTFSQTIGDVAPADWGGELIV
jgi:uncharacterized glyoxalase superfamily protein PhnB